MFARESSLRVRPRALPRLLLIAILLGVPATVWANGKTDTRTAAVLIAEANDAIRNGDSATAIKRLQLAYALDSDVETGLKLGRLLAGKGRLAEATTVLRAVATSKVPPWIAKKMRALKQAKKELKLLEARLPWIRVAVTGPPKKKLQLDGHDIPVGAWLPLDPGHHVLEASAAHYEAPSKDLLVAEASRKTIQLELTPVRRPSTTGSLAVSSDNGAAKLFIDGKRVGDLPWRGRLPPGRYSLKAKGKKASSSIMRVDVELGKRTQVVLELKQQTGSLEVTSIYPAASIYVDGNLVGQGNYLGQVATGKHKINVVLKGYYPSVRHADVEVGKPAKVRVGRLERIATAPQVEHLRLYHGMYVRLAPTLLFGLGKAPDEATRQCISGAICSGKSAWGVALPVHVGWDFGYVGAEYLLMGYFDSNAVTMHRDSGTSLQRDEHYTFYRFGGVAGLGLRASSHGQVRVSVGAGGGLAVGATQYKMTSSFQDKTILAPEYTSGVQIYVAPVLTADVGVLVGHAPGAALFAGVAFYSEFKPFGNSTDGAASQNLGLDPTTGEPRVQDIPSLKLISHAQFYIGPTLGVQFGH